MADKRSWEVVETYESIEYPGWTIDRIPSTLEADMFQAFGRSLYGKYEGYGYQVLHVLSYYNNGLDWFTGERVKADEHGFEVVYKLKYK
jgi:hypothetical protein